MVLPGRRDDRAHLLGLGVAEALVGFWPRTARDMTPGLPDDLRERLAPVGALSRHPVRTEPDHAAAEGGRSVALLLGSGGHDVTADDGVEP